MTGENGEVNRLVLILVLSALVALVTVADTVGRIVIDPAFQVSESIMVPLMGAWAGAVGIDGLAKK